MKDATLKDSDRFALVFQAEDGNNPKVRKFAEANPNTARMQRALIAKKWLANYEPLSIVAIERKRTNTRQYYDVYFIMLQHSPQGPAVRPVHEWMTARAAAVMGCRYDGRSEKCIVQSKDQMRDYLLMLCEAMDLHPGTPLEVI